MEKDKKNESFYHALSKEELSSTLNTSLTAGLTSQEAATRLAKYGFNELEKEEGESLWEKIKEQFEDLLVRLLLGAAIINFVVSQFFVDEAHKESHAWVEPLVIILILIANAAVGIWQDYDAERALDALKELQSEKALALRDGKWIEIASKNLVIGDVVQIRQGDKVPADMRLVELKTLTLRVDQSPLTGESQAVQKETHAIKENKRIVILDNHNTLFSGTLVANGTGIGIVVGTGMSTELGNIQKQVTEAKQEEEDTPLKKRLNEFSEMLARAVLFICIFIWLINYRNFKDPYFGGVLKGALHYFKIAISLAVAAIPEGLPAVITTCLALGTRRMAKHNAIVRKLPSVETLGCTTVICSDKTGTLTTNEMSVEELILFGDNASDIRRFTVEGQSYNPEGSIKGFSKGDANKANIKLLSQSLTLCNESKLLKKDNRVTISGLPTEAALKVLVEKIGKYDTSFNGSASDVEAYNNHVASAYIKRATLEFSRERKSMSVLATDNSSKANVLFIKGAPDYIISKAKSIVLANGTVAPIDESIRRSLFSNTATSAEKGLRTLAICFKTDLGALATYDNEKHAAHAQLVNTDTYANIEKDSTIIGIVAMRDPPRKQVPNSIKLSKQAGINVIMITGDIKETAQAIGQEIGIVHQDYKERSFTGLEFFEEKSENEQKEILRRYIKRGGDGLIFARTEPKHKRKLVQLLKSLNHIVAMTGDGVNDAPALRESHIGVAMGIAGTEVSKEASAMVLADDNFATIVKAVEEGRGIYSNMKAFIRYMISSNIGEVISIFMTSILGIPDGLSSLQLLWVNLVTDGLPATALSFNPPDRDIMKRMPRRHDEPLITPWIFFRYFVIGTYVGLTTVGIFMYWYMYYQSPDGHTLVTFKELANWSECDPKTFRPNNFSPDYDLTRNPCDYFSVAKEKASTLSLSVMVVIEMCNALNAISEEESLLTTGIFGNKWLLLAIVSSLGLHFMLIHVTWLGDIFHVVPLTLDEWKLVLYFSIPVILIDEVLKIFARARSRRISQEVAAEAKTK